MNEKRKPVPMTKEEVSILRWLYAKTLLPTALIMAVSSVVLFYGFQYLMRRTTFVNYGIAPSSVSHDVGQFISAYTVIAVINIVLMLLLTGVVMYVILQNIVMPIIRVTREMKRSLETGNKTTIVVRKTDRLVLPLVELLNKLP